MKSIIYTNNASLTVNGITYEKGQPYNVTDDTFEYLSQDFSAWFIVGRPMDIVEPAAEPVVTQPAEPVVTQPAEPVVTQPAEPIVEPVKETAKTAKK